MQLSPGRSKEIDLVLAGLASADEPLVLATLLKTQGSAFRRPGAMALLSPSRLWAGGVSAGCLEAEVAAKGETVLASGKADFLDFAIDEETDAIFGYGLVCGGSGRILVEPVDAALRESFAGLANAREGRHPLVLVRRFDPEPRRPLLWEAGRPAPEGLDARILMHASQEPVARWEASWLLMGIPPRPRLVLFGATALARSLAVQALELGMEVVVADWRERLLDGFDVAATRLMPEASGLAAIGLDPATVAVVLSHQFQRDREALAELARHPLRMLGVLGSRARLSQLQEGLALNGAALSAPVGLDLGGETPEEVALAILAEIQLALSRGLTAPVRRRRER